MKSLHVFMQQVDHCYAIRLYAGEFAVTPVHLKDGTSYRLMHLPYYLGGVIDECIAYFVQKYPDRPNP